MPDELSPIGVGIDPAGRIVTSAWTVVDIQGPSTNANQTVTATTEATAQAVCEPVGGVIPGGNRLFRYSIPSLSSSSASTTYTLVLWDEVANASMGLIGIARTQPTTGGIPAGPIFGEVYWQGGNIGVPAPVSVSLRAFVNTGTLTLRNGVGPNNPGDMAAIVCQLWEKTVSL